jgi:hypothetical protein
MNRYRSDRRIKGGTLLATNQSVNKIKTGIRNGTIRTRRYKTKEGERLDIIAAKYLGEGRLWWILAATSNIGWGLQVPPGTLINIPVDLNRINALV